MDVLKDLMKCHPLGSLVEDLPKTVPGERAIEVLLEEWLKERRGHEGRITFNEMESLFRAIFFLAHSSSYHTAQARESHQDSLAHEMQDNDNYDEIEKFLLKTSEFDDGFCRDILTPAWDYFCLNADKKGVDIHKDDDFLIEVMRHALKVAYILSYVTACKEID